MDRFAIRIGALPPWVLYAAVLAITAIVYWPVWQAGFVWVDKICFYDNAWLRYGDGWKQLVFHNFYDWVNYFRPLVVALFVLEVRGFEAAPGPMHLVSLALHLANTVLVGLLAHKLLEGKSTSRWPVPLAMLFYALHPALIEPVVWISCQFELAVNFFVLLGLLANIAIRGTFPRAISAAMCFFLAGCAKESAVVFPLLLISIDWMQMPQGEGNAVVRLWRRQWHVYLSVCIAGIAYLGLRHWAMGFLLHDTGHEAFFSLTRVQTVAYLLVTYWRLMVWPMIRLGPLHLVDTGQLANFSPGTLGMDVLAAILVAGGLIGFIKHRTWGAIVVACCAALLPVLHIIPVEFDLSLYHERYAMTAVAMLCALLPRAVCGMQVARNWLPILKLAGASIASLWLGLAVANIRITLPLWSNDIRLWNWALQQNPGLAMARSHLLAALIEANDLPQARQVADMLIEHDSTCLDCMLNVAAFAVQERDLPRLQTALTGAKKLFGKSPNPRVLQAYIIATGQMHEMQGDAQEAADAYQGAIRLEPLDPKARMDMALLLVRNGDVNQGRVFMRKALALFPVDERSRRQKQFEDVVAASTARPATD